MLEFWAENIPQKSEKKVEEHKAPSEFRSDAQFIEKIAGENFEKPRL